MSDPRTQWAAKYDFTDGETLPRWTGLVHVAHTQRILVKLREQVCHRPCRILEVGCGTGRMCTHMGLQVGVESWGLDDSPDAVRFARALAAHVGAAVHLVQGNMLCLPLGNGAFDAVYADSVLEHVSDYGRAVGEMARVVRPGGVVLLTVPNRLRAYPKTS